MLLSIFSQGVTKGAFLLTSPKQMIWSSAIKSRNRHHPPYQLQSMKFLSNKYKLKRVLGIVIDENLTFTSHIENITIKCKQAYNRPILFPDLNPNLAVQLYKSYIRSRLEYNCVVRGHSIYSKNHAAMLEHAQKGALPLILHTSKSAPTIALESELFIPPID